MTEHVERVSTENTSAVLALWPIGLATALSLMGDATLYAVLPLHPADAGIPLTMVGVILSVNRIIRLATNGPAGWLFDRVPDRRWLFLGSLWIGVASTLLAVAADGLPLLLAARLIWGLAWSGIWVGGNAIVLQMAPAHQRGRWVGMYQVWFFFGSALGSLVGGILTDAVGYREALEIGAVISAIGAIAALATVADRQRERYRPPFVPPAMARGIASFRAISPAMWAAAAAHGTNRLVVSGVVSATLGLVVQQALGGDLQWGTWQIGIASVTGALMASRTLVSLVGAPLAGLWSDAIGERWDLLAWGLVLGAAGIAALALPYGWLIVAGTVLNSAAGGSIQALATTLAGEASCGQQHGANLGILYTAGDFGSAIGPLAAYAIMPVAGLGLVYWGCAALMLVVGIWARVVGRSEPHAKAAAGT